MTSAKTRASTLQWADIEVGDEVTPIVRGPMSTAHLMRWSAAIENWHRIHYDRPFATEHDKLPGLPVNGSWKQHLIVALRPGVDRCLGDLLVGHCATVTERRLEKD